MTVARRGSRGHTRKLVLLRTKSWRRQLHAENGRKQENLDRENKKQVQLPGNGIEHRKASMENGRNQEHPSGEPQRTVENRTVSLEDCTRQDPSTECWTTRATSATRRVNAHD